MPNPEELQRKKKEMMSDALARLSPEERQVLLGILELENENRHLQRPRIKEPLKDLVEREVREDDTSVS